MNMSTSPYAPAARMLNEVWEKKKSIKTLAYNPKGELRCNKATYAIVCHVLESKNILDSLIESVKQPIRNRALAYVLLYELLLGPNQAIRGGGTLKRTLTKQEESLRKALVEIQKVQKSRPGSDVTVAFPRYVRVNTLRASVKEVVSTLLQNQHYDNQVFCDVHVPNLLVLPPLTKLHNDFDLVQSHQVVLQDKSSCFSALCLVHGSNMSLFEGDVLDACAAPGNKTSHVAALLAEAVKGRPTNMKKKRPTVYALDRSSSRFSSLQRRMQEIIPSSGAADSVKVVCQHCDFLQTKPTDYPRVRGILLDPSCSGSGIYTSPDRLGETQQSESIDEDAIDPKSRLGPLSNFQLTCLRHAMSFKQAERIVYSTCSIHDIENEGVVAQAVKDNDEWKIVAPSCLNHWKRRGRTVMGLTQHQAQCLIRANQDDDTNGFFVCYLERKGKNYTRGESEKIVFAPPEGAEFYSGQFNSKQNGEAAAASVSNKGTQKNNHDPRKQKNTAASAKESTTALKALTSTREEPKKAVNSKKRAKKIAWKKRQMEQKAQRMEVKKLKLENANC